MTSTIRLTGHQLLAIINIGIAAAASAKDVAPWLERVRVSVTTAAAGFTLMAVATDRYRAAQLLVDLPADAVEMVDGTTELVFQLDAAELKRHRPVFRRSSTVTLTVESEKGPVEISTPEHTIVGSAVDTHGFYPPVWRLIPDDGELVDVRAGSLVDATLLAGLQTLTLPSDRSRTDARPFRLAQLPAMAPKDGPILAARDDDSGRIRFLVQLYRSDAA